ncbi:MAG TPA: bifunctional UDP-3-O-[3-hydroxymyristoyl] N-acetylglucosamine deacetylase/3-hydroxyacyl-ACP dehydratase [Edaphocola sp.]|nr:bifunctional UDP-3-O-[3-hydroxymyristoyl] N-acetylglucosamine deacetylase/3-hydroxyacyl-ACP dehydratase [Edaphocola sp.]
MIQQVNQTTLQQAGSLSGVGLHTGAKTTVTLHPAAENFGYRFKRIDLEGQPVVKADVDFVTDTTRSTTIEHNKAKVSTIEHLLSAFVGMGVDNVLIEIDGPEVPIMDGSAKEFVALIETLGIKELEGKKNIYTLPENLHYYDPIKDVEMLAIPAKEYSFTTLIDFNSEVLGTQHYSLDTLSKYKTEISSSRTFSFLHEIEYLLDKNLIKGGDLNNAIVVVEKPISEESLEKLKKAFNKEDIDVNKKEGILNNLELNFPNEPARHKLLDTIGDLALIGYHINASIISKRPGHAGNIAFAKIIKEYIKQNKASLEAPSYDSNIEPIFDINQIASKLPHRYPFLLVDKIIDISDTHIVGVKNVTFNEPFFQGHFPNNPVMPGVLIVEALAQCGGMLALNIMPETEGGYDTYFVKIDKVRFRQKVMPGDTLILKMELLNPIRRGLCEMKATAYVSNKIVAEAELMAQITPSVNRQ